MSHYTPRFYNPISIDIDIHDFNTRVKNAYDYLVKGHKIKGSIRFRGRQMDHVDRGADVLNRFADKLSDVSTIESKVRLEGRNMDIILAPINKK